MTTAGEAPGTSERERQGTGLLSSAYDRFAASGGTLLANGDYRPWPAGSDRPAWERLPADLRTALVERAVPSLGTPWPALGALTYMDFARTGSRSAHEGQVHARRARLADLVLAECCEGRGRFLDEIVEGLWLTCEESSWVWPAHNRSQGRHPFGPLPDVLHPYVDLGVGETAALLAITRYLLAEQLDEVSPIITERVDHELELRFLQPYLTRDDFVWMGFVSPHPNNWCPWIASNYLVSLLLTERRVETREAGVRKALASLDSFLAGYDEDGACDEGPNYWGVAGGSLFDCLELLRPATGGAFDLYGQPLVQEIGRFMFRVYLGRNHFLNFADADLQVTEISPYLLRTYGERIGSPELSGLAYQLAQANGGDANGSQLLGHRHRLLRALPALFPFRPIEEAPVALPRDVWLPGGQIMLSRERPSSTEGLTLGAKCGTNGESHNHNDVGSFMVYRDGEPVIIDVGRETYRRETFNEHRYELWFTQSAYHNVPLIDGKGQEPGVSFHGEVLDYEAGQSRTRFLLELGPAYPSSAGVRSWRREFLYERGERPSVAVTEEFELERAMPVETILMAGPEPRVAGGVVLLGSGRAVELQVTAGDLDVEVERLPITDARLAASWGDCVYRIHLRAREATDRGSWSYRFSTTGR
ncbi:MAG: heparinase II/III family protein [Candidatus Dormibacteraeota bacterium]|nr:heparinase II/III family protein [Candidatus Dormibacteraeota bacterium]MBO0743458.1 heparinase II/III family protein [Candidatus Dormibacteraeota bacterium]